MTTENLIIMSVIVWLIVGLISTISMYNTVRKDWYDEGGGDYRKYNNGDNGLRLVLYYAPIYILGGYITYYIFLFSGELKVLFWKIPKDK